ncbi:MAG: LCP family protein [Bacillota bacterium]
MRRFKYLVFLLTLNAIIMIILTLHGISLRVLGGRAEAKTPALTEKDPIVILLVGTDYNPLEHMGFRDPFRQLRPEDVRSRSDTVILAFLHTRARAVSLLSIPRDTLVDIPGRGVDKINHSFMNGGIVLLKQCVTRLTGVTPDRFAIIDFAGFAYLVDAIGGVVIQNDTPLLQPGGGVWLQPGTHKLDGKGAVRYVRHRYGDHRADIGRIARQQKFLLALYESVKQGGFLKLYRAFLKTPEVVKTDLTPAEILVLYRSFHDLDSSAIAFYTVPGRPVKHHWDPNMERFAQILEEIRSK